MHFRFVLWLVAVTAVFLSVFNLAYSAWPSPALEAPSVFSGRESGLLPAEFIHVHPRVRIVVFGVEHPIPAGVGISAGSNADNHVSGVAAAPIHTHDSGSVLHVENVNPRAYPRQLTLGYFFNAVWGRRLDSSCIFDYCSGGDYELRMFVDGVPSSEFDRHVLLKDEEILLVFDEHGN